MGLIERAALAAQRPLWARTIQVTVGYLSVLAWSRLTAGRSPGWTLFPFFVFVLLALRVVPAVARRVLRFSGSAQATWAEQRQLAKRFDSYQWQKLFWMGLGLALYTVQSGERFAALLILTFCCLVSGALGLGMWQRRPVPPESVNGSRAR